MEDGSFRSRHELSASPAPLLLFYHYSHLDTTRPFFFVSCRKREPGVLEYLVGVYDKGIQKLQEYSLYSVTLRNKRRRATVPLGEGRVVALNLRRTPWLEFVTLSTEIVHKVIERVQGKSQDSSRRKWLNSKLFPAIGRSLVLMQGKEVSSWGYG